MFLYPESDGMTTEEQHIGLPDVIEGLEMSADLAVVALGQAGDLHFIDCPHNPPLPELSRRESGWRPNRACLRDVRPARPIRAQTPRNGLVEGSRLRSGREHKLPARRTLRATPRHSVPER
jgi:hypothetical protein